MPICSDAISAAVERNCNNNVGGLKAIYITDYENVTAVTDTEPDGVIDTITMASTTQFFDFYFAKNSAMYEENLVQNLEIGSNDLLLNVRTPLKTNFANQSRYFRPPFFVYDLRF